MEGGLLLGGRKRPGRAGAALGAKDEAQLLRRAQAVRVVRAEGRTRLGVNQRTQLIAAEIALVARRIAGTPSRQLTFPCPSTAAIKAMPESFYQSAFRKLPGK